MDGFLGVKPEDLNRFSSQQAVEFFQKLLCAEASAIGLAKNRINVPFAINVPDGGIDAEIRDAEVPTGQGIIKTGTTCYQIKTGNFSLAATATDVSSVVFNGKELKPRVKSCLDGNGTLIIVLFGSDLPDSQQDEQVKKKFVEILSAKDSKYATANVEVWRQNQIIAFLEPFPSLRLQLLERSDLSFSDFHGWESMAEMRRAFFLSNEHEKFITDFRSALDKNDEPLSRFF